MPPPHQRNRPSNWLSDTRILDRAPPNTLQRVNDDARSSDRPRIIAHRGASGHAPENTLSAFALAAEMGADGIELDVHLTKDGQVVVLHNDTVDATTDGRGSVSQMSVQELKTLDAGGWYDARYENERIRTLAEVFETIDPHQLINVEIKVGRGRANPARPRGQLETETVRLIERYDLSHRVLVSSFSPFILRRVRALCADIPLGYLYAQLPGPSPLLALRLIRSLIVPYDALHPILGWVNAQRGSWARQNRLALNVWTVNEPGKLRRMCDLGADSIITNYPDRLSQILAERPGPAQD